MIADLRTEASLCGTRRYGKDHYRDSDFPRNCMPSSGDSYNDRFDSTRWSLVQTAGDSDSPDAHQALASLCEAYWYPIYVFARRTLGSVENAEDATQAFFANLLEKPNLSNASPQRGRFRAYLLGAFKHFVQHERDKRNAQKRGGGHRHISIDIQNAETRFCLEPADNLTPERLYDKQWALTTINRVIKTLRTEYEENGKLKIFDALMSYILRDGPRTVSYTEIAKKLHMSAGTVRVNRHRLKEQFGRALNTEIAGTVNNPSEIAEEIAALKRSLGR